MKLFSYVVDHDRGYAPNPFGRICTLARCKYSKTSRWKNLVELANKDDWIVGIGGVGKESCGRGRIVYAMRVTNKMSLADYCNGAAYCAREDARRPIENNGRWRKALVSSEFYYFGRNSLAIPARFSEIGVGRGFKCRFEEKFVERFVAWIRRRKRGMNGQPCSPQPNEGAPRRVCAEKWLGKL